MSTAMALEIQRVTAGYGKDDVVLDDVTIQVPEQSIVALIGPNGSGKSTTLRAAMGQLPLRRGRVLLHGVDVGDRPPHERIHLGMALLPQGRSVFPGMTVRENLEMGFWVNRGSGRQRLGREIDAAFERFPDLATSQRKPAGTLSGGQQRMLEMARMMMSHPRVVLIDEPGAGLSPKFETEIYAQVTRIRDAGATVLLVDQNVDAAIRVSDTVVGLALGAVDFCEPSAQLRSRSHQVVQSWLTVD